MKTLFFFHHDLKCWQYAVGGKWNGTVLNFQTLHETGH